LGAAGSAGLDAAARRRPGAGCTRPARLLGSRGTDIGSAIFAIEFVSLFFARALFVWFYNATACSVLLAAIFHASFDAAINQLSYDVVPAANAAKFLIFSAVIVLAATTVISLRDSCLDAALARSLLNSSPSPTCPGLHRHKLKSCDGSDQRQLRSTHPLELRSFQVPHLVHSGMLGLLLRCAGVRDVTGTARPDAARQRW
jgi:hypothetical protein